MGLVDHPVFITSYRPREVALDGWVWHYPKSFHEMFPILLQNYPTERYIIFQKHEDLILEYMLKRN